MGMAVADEEALGFFNGLSGMLEVRLTEPTVSASQRLMNQLAPRTARVADVTIRWRAVGEGGRGLREVTEEEWSRTVLRVPRLRMRGEAKTVVEHAAPNGQAFTVRDLATAVAETERQGRDRTEWLGGVDVHHVYFEGIELDAEGVWVVHWGS